MSSSSAIAFSDQENTHSGSLPVAKTSLKNDYLQEFSENTHCGSLPVAETSLKNDHLQENTHSGSLPVAKTPLKNDHLQENSGSAKAIMASRDLEDKKNSSQKERKKAWTVTRPIHILDPWNTKPLLVSGCRWPIKTPKFVDLDVEKLRKLRPDHIPVTVVKDARSDISDIDNKKYHVHGETPLGEFVTFIRLEIRSKKRIFVFFKITKPSMSSLMSAIYEENKGEDGFLHITYSGEKNSMIENSRDGSLDLAESSFKQENHPDPIPEKVQAEENNPDPIPEKMQAEENNPDPIQMTVENTAGVSLLSQVTMRKQKRLADSLLYQVFAKKSLPEQRRKIDDFPKNRIGCLDPWNYIKFKKAMSSSPGMSESVRKYYLKVYQKHYGKEIQRTCPDAKQLREKHPDHIPVILEKDARSDNGIPDIDMNKYHVHGHMTVDQFVGWIRLGLEVGKDFPVRVLCKNTELTADALMSSIDEKNKDDDGFLRLTYSGVERAM